MFSGSLIGKAVAYFERLCFCDALLILAWGRVNTRISGFAPFFSALSIASCIPITNNLIPSYTCKKITITKYQISTRFTKESRTFNIALALNC